MNTLISYPFEWVGQGLLAALVCVLALSAVVGILLVLRPDVGLRINQSSSRWVDTRGVLGTLDRSWRVEPWLYHHHRVLGGSIAAGAAIVLGLWLRAYDRAQVLSALAPRLHAQGLDWIVDGLEWAVVLIHAAALLLGVVILARPSVIKKLEAQANRWYGGPGLAAALDREYNGAARWLETHPRLSGTLALAGSAYALFALSPSLLALIRL